VEKFVQLTARVCPLMLANLNTDQILPARYLKWPRSKGLGAVLFHDLRVDSDGKERKDFPLNQPLWQDASILLAGRNFGGGSSREGAVYALYDHGFRCVLAPSFGDIFAQNTPAAAPPAANRLGKAVPFSRLTRPDASTASPPWV
jgi:3-isopropylmalate/(R)-2-methylmalate dehydratase small subunit